MKPQIVTDWERSVEVIEDMAPRCCWTCCEYNENTKSCFAHGGQEVPDEFVSEVDKCEAWNREPF